ncbi:hypothetical protein [Aquabacterium humicola]|uniref:hypothetical protein n=1 Tax=Aquabacterium humicola TaxID=3237377 RepID=UPI00254342F9|nr:hypothetical protein [Rubrivivax pictus]
MFKQISTQATAFGFAALVTLATLASLNSLASHSAATNPELARVETPATFTVVIVGKRIALS